MFCQKTRQIKVSLPLFEFWRLLIGWFREAPIFIKGKKCDLFDENFYLTSFWKIIFFYVHFFSTLIIQFIISRSNPPTTHPILIATHEKKMCLQMNFLDGIKIFKKYEIILFLITLYIICIFILFIYNYWLKIDMPNNKRKITVYHMRICAVLTPSKISLENFIRKKIRFTFSFQLRIWVQFFSDKIFKLYISLTVQWFLIRKKSTIKYVFLFILIHLFFVCSI